MASTSPHSLGLKQLKAVLLVGETGSVTRYASSDCPDVIFLPLMEAPYFVFAREGIAPEVRSG